MPLARGTLYIVSPIYTFSIIYLSLAGRWGGGGGMGYTIIIMVIKAVGWFWRFSSINLYINFNDKNSYKQQ